jgi:ABC-type lipoprotein export system ATPase subunit
MTPVHDPSTPPPLVEARGVLLSLDAQPVLKGIDVTIGEGAELAITGRSGSGKTSLLLVLSGLMAPTSGDVAWPALDAKQHERRFQIAVVFQSPSLLPELTAVENVSLPLRLRGWTRDVTAGAAHRALSEVGLEAEQGALPSQLSGGQQQRVAVARALAGRPRLILADEPTGTLDRAHARLVLSALRDRARELGAGLVLATHDDSLADLLTRRAVIDDGVLRTVAA